MSIFLDCVGLFNNCLSACMGVEIFNLIMKFGIGASLLSLFVFLGNTLRKPVFWK